MGKFLKKIKSTGVFNECYYWTYLFFNFANIKYVVRNFFFHRTKSFCWIYKVLYWLYLTFWLNLVNNWNLLKLNEIFGWIKKILGSIDQVLVWIKNFSCNFSQFITSVRKIYSKSFIEIKKLQLSYIFRSRNTFFKISPDIKLKVVYTFGWVFCVTKNLVF